MEEGGVLDTRGFRGRILNIQGCECVGGPRQSSTDFFGQAV
jgi:hypothetical protein